jgi:hypothetical protein
MINAAPQNNDFLSLTSLKKESGESCDTSQTSGTDLVGGTSVLRGRVGGGGLAARTGTDDTSSLGSNRHHGAVGNGEGSGGRNNGGRGRNGGSRHLRDTGSRAGVLDRSPS